MPNYDFTSALSSIDFERLCKDLLEADWGIALKFSGRGGIGIGKTTLARMLMLYFYRRDYEVVKIESDVSEARDVPYHSQPRFYYYDDFLGQTAQADKLNKNEDQKLLDFMTSVRDSKHTRFVLTTRVSTF